VYIVYMYIMYGLTSNVCIVRTLFFLKGQEMEMV
jgi:hypothetical protein